MVTNISSFLGLESLKVDLAPQTKSLNITFLLLKNNFISSNHIHEFQKILKWLNPRTEINSVLIKSNKEYFCQGLANLNSFSKQSLENTLFSLKSAIYFMFYLPQTIIVDMGLGARALGIEIALGADLKMASEDAEFEFNHLELGVIPASGGIGLLETIVGLSRAKTWVLGGEKVSSKEGKSSGLIGRLYRGDTERESTTKQILNKILNQSSIGRIQTKLAFLKNLDEILKKQIKGESPILKGAMASEDWKKRPFFTDPKTFLTALSKPQGPTQ